MFIGITSDENLKFEENDNEGSIDLDTNGTLINFKINSGAQVNILHLNEYNRLQNFSKLRSTVSIVCLWWLSYSTKTFLYSTHQTQSANNFSFVFSSRYQFHTQIGLNTSTKLNLIKRVIQINSPLSNYLKEFRGCFSDIGCLPGKHHIVIDTRHPPDVNSPRRIPYTLREKLKAELDKMIEMKIIQAVNE